MKTRLRLSLVSLLASIPASLSLPRALAAAGPVTVEVAITAPGGHGYELRGGGAQKVGNLPPRPGYVTISDAIVVDNAGGAIPVTLKFYDRDGLVSTCPVIEVVVEGGRPSCLPRFTLTATQLSFRNYLCELTCPPAGGNP